MADFPSLTPTIRPLTPGRWGGATLAAMSGQTSTVRRSSAEIGRRVSLRFENITEAQFLQIVDHYRGQRSGLDGFNFNSATIPTSYTPSGHTWLYAGPPQVVDRHQDVFTVELECRSEPRGPFRVSGVAFTTLPALAAGAPLAIVSGLAITPVESLTAGTITPIVAGLAITPVESLTAGTITPIVAGVSLKSGGSADPQLSSVSLLLHMDGSNGSTTFTDSSNNAFSITASGNAQISTTDPKSGSGALTLDGAGDFLSTPANSAFAFGTGDLTVECWAFINSGNANNGLFTFGGTSSGLALAVFSGNWVLTTAGGGGTTMGAVTTGAWQHVAVTRSGSSLRLFINGVQLGSTITNSTNLSDNQLRIGYYFSSSFAINARIDEFRVTKGIARYTSEFTTPIDPFPDALSDSSPILLTPGSATGIVAGAGYSSISPSLAPGAPV